MRKIISHLKENWIRYGFETLVVVVGILGAYSLNNWNESVKIGRIEQELLSGLKMELLNNKSELEYVIEKHEIGRNHHIIFMQLFNEKSQNLNETEIDSVITLTLGPLHRTFDPKIGYLKSIITSGKLGYIRNQQLVSLISAFEDLAKDATEDVSTISEIWNHQVSPLFIKYYHYKFSKEIPANNKFPQDFNGLFLNSNIESWFRVLYFWRWNLLNEEKDLLTTLDTMITIIEGELEDK